MKTHKRLSPIARVSLQYIHQQKHACSFLDTDNEAELVVGRKLKLAKHALHELGHKRFRQHVYAAICRESYNLFAKTVNVTGDPFT